MRSVRLPTLATVRLLDHIAHCAEPFFVREKRGTLWRLTGASDFATQLAHSPLRYVLCEDVVQTCTELAYANTDELCGCLDLLHVPAEHLWIEWDENARRAALGRVLPQRTGAEDSGILRAGALVRGQMPRCRAASVRTFWLTREEPQLAAVETLLDLEDTAEGAAPQALLAGDAVTLHDPLSEPLDRLLQHARFRLDPSWLRYYRCVAGDATQRDEITRRSLGAVAFDVPMLLALFLLMAVRAGLSLRTVDPARLNAKRTRLGRRPLLEHIEVSAPLLTRPECRAPSLADTARRAPRLHHVRGHIVRRRDAVFWRSPHWRGHVRLGRVRSRTVELHLPR